MKKNVFPLYALFIWVVSGPKVVHADLTELADTFYRQHSLKLGADNAGYLFGSMDAAAARSATEALRQFSQEEIPSDRREMHQWMETSNEIVRNSSEFLQTFYFQRKAPTTADEEAFAELRTAIRRQMKRSLEVYERDFARYRDRNPDEKNYPGPSNPFKLVGLYNGFWHDEPGEWKSFLSQYFRAIRHHNFYEYAVNLDGYVYDSRSQYKPFVAVWDPDKKEGFRNAYWERLIDLSQSNDYRDRLDALRIKLVPIIDMNIHRNDGFLLFTRNVDRATMNLNDSLLQERRQTFEGIDYSRVTQLSLLYSNALWAARRQLAAGDIHWRPLLAHYLFLEEVNESIPNGHYREKADRKYHELRRSHFQYFLTKGSKIDRYYLRFYPLAYAEQPPAEVKDLLEKAAEVHPAGRESFEENWQAFLALTSNENAETLER